MEATKVAASFSDLTFALSRPASEDEEAGEDEVGEGVASVLTLREALSPAMMDRAREADTAREGGRGRERGTGEVAVTEVEIGLTTPDTMGDVEGAGARGVGVEVVAGWCCCSMMLVYCFICSSCCAIMPFSRSMAWRSSLSF